MLLGGDNLDGLWLGNIYLQEPGNIVIKGR